MCLAGFPPVCLHRRHAISWSWWDWDLKPTPSWTYHVRDWALHPENICKRYWIFAILSATASGIYIYIHIYIYVQLNFICLCKTNTHTYIYIHIYIYTYIYIHNNICTCKSNETNQLINQTYIWILENITYTCMIIMHAYSCVRCCQPFNQLLQPWSIEEEQKVCHRPDPPQLQSVCQGVANGVEVADRTTHQRQLQLFTFPEAGAYWSQEWKNPWMVFLNSWGFRRNLVGIADTKTIKTYIKTHK